MTRAGACVRRCRGGERGGAAGAGAAAAAAAAAASLFLSLRFFAGFASLYFFGVNSGYTEPLFALMMVFCIYKYLNGNYFWPTILISFFLKVN